MKKALVVDFDGTLVEYVNSWDIIRDAFGLRKHMWGKLVLTGVMSEREFRAREIEEWRRRGITKDRLERLFHEMPIKKGARTILSVARERGYIIAVISQAPSFVLEMFYRLTGFNPDFEASYRFEFDVDGFVSGICFPYTKENGLPCKMVAAKAFAEAFGVARENVVAVGDHINDAEMMEWAGYSIAVGPNHPRLYDVADRVIGSDLSEMLGLL
ncbi:MAG: HAD family hydrolase [Candidatus Bathyarchaeia archaeon]